ncbi:hypothetical protein V8G54_026521 [Vigna mungo]|uniref:Protein FAR1-RELATED SEQUENCE n=1 Tax=Vigna mungo TaxID=3915 RepID=A0AAQ3RN94_VIGMU
MVTCFENSHNHALLDEKEIRFLPAYHDIPINDQARTLLLSKVCCSVSLIMRVIDAEKGIKARHLPLFDRDIRNFIKSQSSIDKENDASDVLKLCKDLKDKDDAFQYDFTLDESNKLEHIIWVFGDSIRAYEAFGDVVVFDTTYRINRYDMSLGLWVGVYNQIKLDKRRKCVKSIMKTSFLIEEQATSILTPYAFELLQHEIELSTKYAATVIDNDSYSVQHHTKLGGGRSNDYFSIPEEYLPSRWRRESTLIPQSRHIINYNDNFSVESLKTKDQVEVATKELKKVIHCLKGMPEVQENSIDLEHGVLNVDQCDAENPITSKTKGQPRGSRAKGGVEAAKKPRHCHHPNCGGIDHDSRNCQIKSNKDSLLASQSSLNK